MSIFTNKQMILPRFLATAFLSVLLGAVVVSNGRDACAQSWSTGQPDTCDPAFADVLDAKTQLEVMREVEIAQTLILRPDSVLEYSCFDDRIGELSIHANAMFSDNIFSPDMFNIPAQEYSRPGRGYDAYLPVIEFTGIGPTIPGNAERILRTGPNPPPFPPGRLMDTSLDDALSAVVFDTMYQYLLSNFAHVYAAGTFSGPAPPLGVCNPMDAVWHFIKCTNFNIGLFRNLGEMAFSDPRVNAVTCTDPNRATRWSTALAAAYPDPSDPGGVDSEMIIASNPNVYEHTIDMFNTNCSASDPIPTGLRVYRGAPPVDAHADFVCPAPGCYYEDGTGCVEAP